MQVTGSLVNNKSNQDGIEIAEFYLPEGKFFMRNHAGDQWDSNAKKRNQQGPNTNIIDPLSRSNRFYRWYARVRRHFNGIRSLPVFPYEIRK